MKKSELKTLVFESICEYYQDRYRKHVLKEWPEDLDSFDDEPYERKHDMYSEPDMNTLRKALFAAVENGGGFELKLRGKQAYVLASEQKGNYRFIVIKWEGEGSDGQYGQGWDYVDGAVPVEWGDQKIDYMIHKVMRKLGLLKEDIEKDKDMVFGEGEQLPDSTDQILAKFPTLKHALVRLQTEQFEEFVSGIDWISPKPTQFRINLKNGQNFTLKWMGKDFEAEISGKKYYLGQLVDFQRAIDKLSELYQEGPMGTGEEGSGNEGGSEGGPDFGGGSTGGGGDFPGGESGGVEETPEEGGPEPEGESGATEGGEDLGNADIDFESDESI